MKLFVENWRNHLQEQELNKLRTQILNEITQKEYKYIKDWMANAPEEAYSFNSLFNGKKRIAVPINLNPATGPIGDLLKFFADGGWQANFNDSTLSKETEKTIPKGPRAGEKIKQVKKIRIGKELQRVLALYEKLAKGVIQYTRTRMKGDIKGAEEISKDNQKIRQQMAFEYPTFEAEESTPPSRAVETLKHMVKFWNTKSEYYRQNPDAAFDKRNSFVTILSRHPVDVVRMSDINNIKSCHSRKGGYFECAVAESRGHGPIAYLVSRPDFENHFNVDLSTTDPTQVDLDQEGEEIFDDPERQIKGMLPIGRIRLRKFIGPEGIQLAVPEAKTYAPRPYEDAMGQTQKAAPPGFLRAVADWALKNQRDVVPDPNKLNPKEWKRHGGSYQDTQDGALFAKMFKSLLSPEKYRKLKKYGNTKHVLEPEAKIKAAMQKVSIPDKINALQNQADHRLKGYPWKAPANEKTVGFKIDHKFEKNMDISYGVDMFFNLEKLFGPPQQKLNEDKNGWQNYNPEVSKAMLNILPGPWREFQRNEINKEGVWHARVEKSFLSDDETGERSMRYFENFVHQVFEVYRMLEKNLATLRNELVNEGLITFGMESALPLLKGYKWLRVGADTQRNLLSVFLRNTKPYTHRSLIDDTLNDKQKSLISSLYTEKLAGKLIPQFTKKLKELGLPPSIMSPGPDLLDMGEYEVGPRFHLDFNYEDVQQVPLIMKFLKMLDSEGFQYGINDKLIDAWKETIQELIQKYGSVDQYANFGATPPRNENLTKNKVSDKMLFESWRRYLYR